MIPIEPVERRRGEAVERLEIASMIGHHVEHDIKALRMSRIDQLHEFAHAAEVAVYAIEIVGPVAVVGVHMTLHLHRRDPDRSESHPLDIVQFVNHALEIAAMPLAWIVAIGIEPAVVIIGGVSVGEAVSKKEVY